MMKIFRQAVCLSTLFCLAPLSAGDASVLPQPTTPMADDAPRLQYAGYVRSDFFYDTRQVNGRRDDFFLFLPEPKLTDSCGCDINANGQLHMDAFHSRMGVKLKGPDVCGAKTFGLLEGDFFGIDDATVQLVRLRHAFFKLDWDFISLLCGQYYHPMRVEECVPSTVSVTVGRPIDSNSRNPQARVTLKLSDWVSLITSIAGEVDAESTGPSGTSTSYIRNGQTPLLHAQLQAVINKKHYVGIGVDFRSLRPRIVTDKNFKVDERVDAISAIAYAAFNFEKFLVKTKILYAENTFAYRMLGGYGITSVDPATDGRTYKPLRSFNAWTELECGPYNVGCGKIKPGFFIGVTKNLGVSTCLVPFTSISGAKSFTDVLYGRGTNVDLFIRAAPRVRYLMKAIDFGFEIDITHARFGTVLNSGRVAVNDPETNVRFLVSGFYRF